LFFFSFCKVAVLWVVPFLQNRGDVLYVKIYKYGRGVEQWAGIMWWGSYWAKNTVPITPLVTYYWCSLENRLPSVMSVSRTALPELYRVWSLHRPEFSVFLRLQSAWPHFVEQFLKCRSPSSKAAVFNLFCSRTPTYNSSYT
jgi:hypothetical protein